MEALLHDFHFIRPAWLLALLPLAWLLRRWWGLERTSRSWQAVCDPRLLPFLLQGTEQARPKWPYVLAALTGLLAVIALAGPSWERMERPVLRNEAAMVVLLDLSRSMDATDLKPTRLTRARLKLLDILKRRDEGLTALIAFAAQPYTVSPLTSDAETIAAQVPVLESGLMPSQGSRLDLAISSAMELLQRGNAPVGELLYIGDGVAEDDARIDAAIDKLRKAGYRLSVLGVGTPDGGPIGLGGGGFLKDVSGQIVIPRLDRDALMGLAQKGAGRFTTLAADDSDIDYLLSGGEELTRALDESDQMQNSDEWFDAGFLLVPLLLPAALLLFRRGVLWVVIPLLLIQQPQRADAWGWDELWQTPDQRGAAAFAAEDYPRAAAEFENPAWRAMSAYRQGDLAGAAKAWAQVDSAEGHYNRGTVLGLMGQYKEALEALDRALELNPDHREAQINKEMIEAKLKELAEQAQQQQPQDQQPGDEGEQQQSYQQQNGNGQQGQGDDSQQEQPQPGEQGDESGSDGQQSQANEAEQSDQQQADAAQPGEDEQQAEEEGAQQVQPDQPQEGDKSDKPEGDQALSEMDEAEQLRQQQLRAIPDDPGGLLRRKFQYLYQRFNSGADEAQPW